MHENEGGEGERWNSEACHDSTSLVREVSEVAMC